VPPTTSCPDPDRLKEWLDGALPGDEQAALSGHVESCEACQQALEGLAAGGESWLGIARQLQQGPDEPSPGLLQAIEELRDMPQTAETHIGESTGAELPLDFLGPPDQPEHLGKIDHYEVLEVVGRGAFGTVLRAFDQRLHRVVAIKVMSPQLASSVTARKRFIREGRNAAGVCHEQVVTIHAVSDESSRLPYLVMQFVQGVSLQERLDRRGPPALNEVLRIGMQAAAGLAAAHAQGLVHRDIKPSNILLENGVERVKITDFGLARAVDDASLTQTGVIAGTPQYMAPEQARGETVDHRADLFSLGSVLYALCAGRPPFRASTTMAVLKRVCEETPRPLREINPDIPEWLAAIIAKLQAKNPSERFQSADEVSELLGRCLAHVQQPERFSLPAPVAASQSAAPPSSSAASPVITTDQPSHPANQSSGGKVLGRSLSSTQIIGGLLIVLGFPIVAVLLQVLELVRPGPAQTVTIVAWTMAWMAQFVVFVIACIQRVRGGSWTATSLGSGVGALAALGVFAALDTVFVKFVMPAAKSTPVLAVRFPWKPADSDSTVKPATSGRGRLIVEAQDPMIRLEVLEAATGAPPALTKQPHPDPGVRFDDEVAAGRYDIVASIDDRLWFRARVAVAAGGARRVIVPLRDSQQGRLQGRWIVVAKETNGVQLPAEVWSGSRIEFAADQMRQVSPTGEVAEGIFQIKLRDPKGIDFLDQSGQPLLQGIYRLEGDRLTVCLGPMTFGGAALPRPNEFRTRRNNWGDQLCVCRRAQTDIAPLQGRWNVTSQDWHGRMLPESEREAWWEFRDDLLLRSAAVEAPLRVEVENGADPKEIDLFTPAGTPYASGIYQIEDERMIVCLGTPGQRPSVFPATAPAGQVVTMLSRPPLVPVFEAASPPRDIGGAWDSDYGEVVFEHESPIGGRPVKVKGAYVTRSQGFHGEFEGTFDPQTGILETTWRERGLNSSGTARHLLSPDGNTLTGSYRYGKQPESQEYDWNMTRQPHGRDPGVPTIAETDDGVLVETGNLVIDHPGEIVVRYPCPYAKPPFLQFPVRGREGFSFQIKELNETWFRVGVLQVADAQAVVPRFQWEARGKPRKAGEMVMSQLGFVTIDHAGKYEIQYPRPFAYPPNLQFPIDDDHALESTLVDETLMGFSIDVQHLAAPAGVTPRLGWRATGVPREQGLR
jgi:serine/threonine-protein kinase